MALVRCTRCGAMCYLSCHDGSCLVPVCYTCQYSDAPTVPTPAPPAPQQKDPPCPSTQVTSSAKSTR